MEENYASDSDERVKNVIIDTGNVDSKKIDVVYGSVDVNVFKPGRRSTIRKEFKITPEKKIIGFIGNSGKRKGLEYLLNNLHSLKFISTNSLSFSAIVIIVLSLRGVFNFSIPIN